MTDGCRRRFRGRWIALAAVVALLSLQITATDHWHGVTDTEPCQICVHAGDLPLAGSPQLDVPPVSPFGYVASAIQDRRGRPVAVPGQRAPPILG